MTKSSIACWNCGESCDEPLPLSRHAACQHCFEMLHCCLMCRHFDPHQRPACQHDLADPPRESDSANFCDFLTPRRGLQGRQSARDQKASAKLSALFGDASDIEDEADLDTDDQSSSAERQLQNLFGDDD